MVVTLRDVARAAGVSPATASRALSAPDLVAPARREHVQQVARELGYRPNRAARELHHGRAPGTSCLVVPDLENPFFAAVAKGVQARARALGLRAARRGRRGGPPPRERARRAPRRPGGRRHPVLPADDRRRARPARPGRARRRRPPAARQPAARAGCRPSSSTTRTASARRVTHLYALGHRRIGYAGGPVGSWSDAQRRRGLEHASHGLRSIDVVDLGHFPPLFGGGVAAGDLVAASGVTAVLAHNDLLALGILSRLRARGVRVPERRLGRGVRRHPGGDPGLARRSPPSPCRWPGWAGRRSTCSSRPAPSRRRRSPRSRPR